MDIAQAIAAINGVIQLVDNLSATTSRKEVEEARLEMLRNLGEVHQTVTELRNRLEAAHNRIHELEAELDRMQAWDNEEAQHYELKEIGPGALAFIKKKDPQGVGADPPHALCAHCFQNKERSILQFAGHESGLRMLECPRCKNRVRYHNPGDSTEVQVVQSRFRRDLGDY